MGMLIIYRSHYPACSTIVAEFTLIDALPCAKVQSAVGYGYGDTHSE